MSKFFINRPIGFESTIKTIVKQTFPSVSPSEIALSITEKGMLSSSAIMTTKVSGSRRERFVWGSSRLGSSRLVG